MPLRNNHTSTFGIRFGSDYIRQHGCGYCFNAPSAVFSDNFLSYSMGNTLYATLHTRATSRSFHFCAWCQPKPPNITGRHLGVDTTSRAKEQGLAFAEEAQANGWQSAQGCQQLVQMSRMRRDQENTSVMSNMSGRYVFPVLAHWYLVLTVFLSRYEKNMA